MYNLKGNEFPKMTFLLLLVCILYFIFCVYFILYILSNESEHQSWSDVLVFDIKRSDFDK